MMVYTVQGAMSVIKAVFFDLYHTLVHYEPSQEELEAQALQSFGIDVTVEALHRPILAANEFIYQEMAVRPLSQRSKEEVMDLYARYQQTVIKEAGIAGDQKLALRLLVMMQQAKMKLVLFDDVAPALDDLKKRSLILGLISNIERDMTATLKELGLASKLDIVVTSQDAGCTKPRPEIFQYAIRKAGVLPAETVYIGDQYQVDVLGSRGAGMKSILLDRGNYYLDITDCPRITSLAELPDYLK
jgi:putative hydrolase of the HAD superfamily